VPPLRRQRRDLPRGLAEAIDRALRPRIHDRGTLAQLRDALAASVGQVGEEAGIVAGAWDRTREADAGDDEVAPGTRRLWWPRDAPLAAASADAPEPPDPSRLIWQARALGAVGAAAAAAWLSHRLIAPHASLAAPLPLTALVAAGVTLLLPRLGWLAIVAYLCLAAIVGHEPGAAVVLAAGALVPIVLLPASPSLWPVAAAAPALGLIGLAGGWPALAGWSRSPWRRAMLGATGWLWTVLIGVLTGRTLYLPRPHRVAPAGAWIGSVSGAVTHGLEPLARSGILAPALLWAAGALLLPSLVHGRSLALDALRVILWAAALVAATGPVIRFVSPGARDVSAPSAIAGAVAAAVLALAPVVLRQMRTTARARSFGAGVP
jgi:eukaryotic-like serine/threonine-protein kinase